MAQSVLGSLTLGYRPLWGRGRSLAGVQLFVHEDDEDFDGNHLLRTVAELWSSASPTLLLSPRSRHMLAGLLQHADAGSPMIEVPGAWLDDAAVRADARAARQRGARLIVSGAPQAVVDAEAARWFERRLLSLSAADAVTALQAVQRHKQQVQERRMVGLATGSPVQPQSIVEGVASRALAEHALDQQGAWAVAGWPDDDVLHRYRGQPLPPSRRALVRTMNALDQEQSLDRIEQMFGEEPTLAYRLLLYLNSAGMGLRNGLSSLRHGVMMLGFRTLNGWLAEQLPNASDDANLYPVNAIMVMRGHLMTHLMDAGIQDDLRREVYLCGLFAQLDAVMDEPLRTSLGRLPLPERIVSATLSGGGPYAGSLQIALAMESADPAPVRALRLEHDMLAEDVNRALLRMLAVAA